MLAAYWQQTSRNRMWVPLALLVSLSGCAVQWNAPTEAAKLSPVDDPVRIHIGLYMSSDWRNAKSETETNATNSVIGLGDSLTMNAEQVARLAFSEYTVLDVPRAGADTTIDAIMTPTVLLIDNSVGAIAWGNANDTIQIQWRVDDPAGNLIWIQTVQGNGTGKTGTAFRHIEERERRIADMLTEAFAKSVREMTLSSDLRALE